LEVLSALWTAQKDRYFARGLKEMELHWEVDCLMDSLSQGSVFFEGNLEDMEIKDR